MLSFKDWVKQEVLAASNAACVVGMSFCDKDGRLWWDAWFQLALQVLRARCQAEVLLELDLQVQPSVRMYHRRDQILRQLEQ